VSEYVNLSIIKALKKGLAIRLNIFACGNYLSFANHISLILFIQKLPSFVGVELKKLITNALEFGEEVTLTFDCNLDKKKI